MASTRERLEQKRAELAELERQVVAEELQLSLDTAKAPFFGRRDTQTVIFQWISRITHVSFSSDFLFVVECSDRRRLECGSFSSDTVVFTAIIDDRQGSFYRPYLSISSVTSVRAACLECLFGTETEIAIDDYVITISMFLGALDAFLTMYRSHRKISHDAFSKWYK